MADHHPLAAQFCAALQAADDASLTALLTEDVALRVAGWQGTAVRRPLARVIDYLRQEWAAWPDPTLTLFTAVGDAQRVAVEFRVQATEQGRYIEHNRAAFLQLKGEQIELIDLYCPEPMPSAHRKGWIAPPDLSEAQLTELFATMQHGFDLRDWMPPQISGNQSLRGGYGGSGDAHPGSNGTGGWRWSDAEADARIEERLAYYRDRNIGFQWFVGPEDRPVDLAQRLERHGLVLAGDQALMARVGLEHLADIPTNPEVTVERLGPASSPAALEDSLQVTARCFNWTAEQINEYRPGMLDRMSNPAFANEEFGFLARVDGVAVANARLLLNCGVAYLGGAATLPEYRSRRIYSTMLRQRLETAREQGYHIAAIHAEPMSRRVVTKYGFREYARYYLYAWMPVIDMDVIRKLVPDE